MEEEEPDEAGRQVGEQVGEVLALKAVMRWLVARELARSPDPHASARRLEAELEEAIELARLAHSEEAIRVATAAMQNMMDLIDLPSEE